MAIYLTYISLLVFGLCLGSFAGATVWRLRARQLVEDKVLGEMVDKTEYKQLVKLTGRSTKDDRSLCLHCGHQLRWYDLLPLISWLSTAGACRYCHKFIGWFEPLVELGTASLFLASFIYWPVPLQTPFQIGQFIVWLIACVGLVILFVYDFKWLLLPDRITLPLGILGAAAAVTTIIAAPMVSYAIYSLLGAIAILSGIYLLAWRASKGRWVGFGDIKLGLVLALFLGGYQLAFIALFAANIIGCVIVLIGLSTGKIKAKTHLPLGPLLILGAIIAKLWGPHLLEWYFALTLY